MLPRRRRNGNEHGAGRSASLTARDTHRRAAHRRPATLLTGTAGAGGHLLTLGRSPDGQRRGPPNPTDARPRGRWPSRHRGFGKRSPEGDGRRWDLPGPWPVPQPRKPRRRERRDLVILIIVQRRGARRRPGAPAGGKADPDQRKPAGQRLQSRLRSPLSTERQAPPGGHGHTRARHHRTDPLLGHTTSSSCRTASEAPAARSALCP